jgi:hypothetical protein
VSVDHQAQAARLARCGGTLVLCALLASLASCGVKPKAPFTDKPGSGTVENPFVPASMTIHPLTRLDTDSNNKLWIYCHIEFKDSWGDSVKAVGALQVQLYRPTGGRAAGPGKQELVWNVDLTDLQKNAGLYDPATRTYRLPLENPPSWLRDPAPESDLPKARLRAVFTTSGPRGEVRTLEDEFPLSG